MPEAESATGDTADHPGKDILKGGLMARFVSTIFTSLLLISALFLAPEARALTVVAGEKDEGRAVELHLGDKLEVVLAANPSTGYLWSAVPMQEGVLRQAGEPDFKTDSANPGAGGKVTFRFEAVKTGKTWLSLNYGRPFEKTTPPARTFSLRISVP
jgi:inhibitor of cysteine peptidase